MPTYVCQDEDDRRYVLEHLDQLVVKAANESGGYGMLIGPHSTQEEREKFAALSRENPRHYIAQPTLTLSRVPTIVEEIISIGLHEFLDSRQLKINHVGDAIHETFFSLSANETRRSAFAAL